MLHQMSFRVVVVALPLVLMFFWQHKNLMYSKKRVVYKLAAKPRRSRPIWSGRSWFHCRFASQSTSHKLAPESSLMWIAASIHPGKLTARPFLPCVCCSVMYSKNGLLEKIERSVAYKSQPGEFMNCGLFVKFEGLLGGNPTEEGKV